MQEEVDQKTIALSMKTGKLTAQVLQAALKKYLQHRAKGKTTLHHGQQSLKQLKKHGAALSNIEITDAQYRPFPALRQEIRRGLHAAERRHHPAPALHRDFQGQGRRQHGTGVQGVHSQEIAAGGTALNPQGYCRKQGKGGGPQR